MDFCSCRTNVKSSLRELYLRGNYLKTIPTEALRGMSHLTILDLSGNQFNIIQGNVFTDISDSLSELRLAGCGIHSISDDGFIGLGSLKTLDLSDNGLYNPPNNAFASTPLIENLHIGANNLCRIDRHDYLFLRKLKHSDLNGCKSGSLALQVGLFRYFKTK